MLKSHRDAVPPQRWTGWGYESDPNVWSHDITRSDSQYWFGDALMIAGIYEPGASTARVYLPGHSTDPGFLNTSAPYEYLAAGKWHEVSSTWHTSIPVIARVGSAIPIGKTVPTTCIAEADPEFPNMAKDDWRGVEIFPPPPTHDAEISAKTPHADASLDNVKWYFNEWLEDDGISTAEKAALFTVAFSYAVSDGTILVKVAYEKQGDFQPLWLRNGLNIVLPTGDERAVSAVDGVKGRVESQGRDDQGRRIFRYTVSDN